MRGLNDINLAGRRVLLRVDLGIRPHEREKLANEKRIKPILPTLKAILAQQGRPIILTHLGGPEGRMNPSYSIKPWAEKLNELLEADVKFIPACIGPEVEQLCHSLTDNQVAVLENLRFHSGEKENDFTFAGQLARLGEVYVNDALAASQGAFASTVGVTSYIQEKAAGLRLEAELSRCKDLLSDFKPPVCLLLGGSKAAAKLEVLGHLVDKIDKLILGGAPANTFLAAQGVQMGRSLYEPELIPKVLELMGALARAECKVYVPVDFQIGKSPKSRGITRAVTTQEIPADTMALDIGPATTILFSEALTTAETILWNGPMGAFENEDYSQGTTHLVQALAAAHGVTIAGGSDTEAAVHALELEHKFDYLSSGGAAFLTLLDGRRLPGVEALRKRS